MASEACHSQASESPRERAKALVLKGLGVKRVAAWCGVAEDTVYQWLARGTDDEPFPPARVPAVLAGARAAALEAPIHILWPAMAEASK